MNTSPKRHFNKITIIIAEDDPDDLNIFLDSITLFDQDISIHPFSNGDELMSRISDHQFFKPDMIFLDINLPYVNGLECLKRIRNDIRYTNVPIIMLTSSDSKQDIMASYYSGATRFITKPDEFKGWVNIFQQLFDLYFQRRLNKTDLLNFIIQSHSIKYSKLLLKNSF